MLRSFCVPSFGLALVVVSALCLLVIMTTPQARLPCNLFPATSIKNEAHAMRPCDNIVEELDNEFDLRRESRQNYTRKVGGSSDAKKLYDLFEPEANCLSEERFGDERFASFGDGPKFVCGINFIAHQTKETNKTCLVYSIGSNNDISFEKSVSKHLGCEIHTFDPTVRAEDFVGISVASFHEWGLGEDGAVINFTVREGGSFTSMSLRSMIKQLDHMGRRIDLLKIDCEGCEWQALPDIFDAIHAGEMKVDQIQIELHGGQKDLINSLFHKADAAQMRIMHKERNHWGCDGYRCLEYVFVSESFLKKVHEWQICRAA